MTGVPDHLDGRDLLQVVFESNADPIMVVSEDDGVVLMANAAADDLLGGQAVGEVFGVPQVGDEPAQLDVVRDGVQRIYELSESGSTLDGRPVRVATLRDVTDHVRSVNSLAEFVSTASHEFRAPILAISGFANLLLTGWAHLSGEDREGYLAIMARQSQRLGRTLDRLLIVAQGGHEVTASPRAVPLQSAVNGAVAMLSTDVLSGADVTTDIPPLRVSVDEDHLDQILLNLLSNAAKYGEQPYGVTAVRDGDRVIVRIIDHGPGVSDAFRDRMFVRYARAEGGSLHLRGLGLGLALVADLAARNIGHVRYEETPGGGATFVVDLPAAD